MRSRLLAIVIVPALVCVPGVARAVEPAPPPGVPPPPCAPCYVVPPLPSPGEIDALERAGQHRRFAASPASGSWRPAAA
jgi:hypothetical protein